MFPRATDLKQLVNSHVTLVPHRDGRYWTNGVVSKFGVRPTTLLDYLMLVSDTVD